MITLPAFVRQRQGKLCDFDGVYGAQCVDLAKFYTREVWGLPAIKANAVDYFGKLPSLIKWTRNDPSNPKQIPPRGALIVWHQDWRVGTGVFGHIAIVTSANVRHFQSFDQNWPVGAAPHLVEHEYEGITGWGVKR